MPGKINRRPRVVLDSNVLISAVVFGGKPREILEHALRGELTLIVSPAVLDEVEAVLGGEKFRFSGAAARAVVQEIESLAEIVDPVTAISVVPDDPDVSAGQALQDLPAAVRPSGQDPIPGLVQIRTLVHPEELRPSRERLAHGVEARLRAGAALIALGVTAIAARSIALMTESIGRPSCVPLVK